MRRLLWSATATLVVTASLFAQRVNKEGKAWLDGFTDAPTVNVTGLWTTKAWGRISLNQSDKSREVVGSGDGWEISGVVSGSTVYLLFADKGRIAYTAKLSSEGAGQLKGAYSKGMLTPNSKTIPLVLTK